METAYLKLIEVILCWSYNFEKEMLTSSLLNDNSFITFSGSFYGIDIYQLYEKAQILIVDKGLGIGDDIKFV